MRTTMRNPDDNSQISEKNSFITDSEIKLMPVYKRPGMLNLAKNIQIAPKIVQAIVYVAASANSPLKWNLRPIPFEK